jgi:hypothetical protein
MRLALSKAAIESQLTTKFGEDVFKLNDRHYAEVLSTGIPAVDDLVEGFPRGAITEIFGPESSGRTGLMLSALAQATTHDEVCALVDTNDVLDLSSAVNAAVELDRLLWIRCGGNLEHSFKAVDLLLHGGGFGLVFLDLGDVQAKEARRIITSWWHRFRRVVENTPTALVVIAQDSCVRSCASLTLALGRKESVWSTVSEGNVISAAGTASKSILASTRQPVKKNSPVTHANLLRGNSIMVERLKPTQPRSCNIRFTA